ncbi:MAG TPA: response regulator transcription factor [Thermodesulfobacteriota bacterium]
MPPGDEPTRARGGTAGASEPVRILLADDHDVVRRGLHELLSARPAWRVCAEAVEGREAVELTLRHRPHIVVLDLSLPGLNGLDVIRQIRSEAPESEILVYTMHESEQLAREALLAGARGFVVKSDSIGRLVDAIEALARHRAFVTPRMAGVVEDGPPSRRRRPPSDADPRLTSREREVVQLLAEGKSNKELSVILGISVKTVETHRAAVMRKLGLGAFADLVRYAIRNGLVRA